MDRSVGSAEGFDQGSVPGAMQLVRGNMEAFETNSASTVGTGKAGHNPFVTQPDAKERLAQIQRSVAAQEQQSRPPYDPRNENRGNTNPSTNDYFSTFPSSAPNNGDIGGLGVLSTGSYGRSVYTRVPPASQPPQQQAPRASSAWSSNSGNAGMLTAFTPHTESSMGHQTTPPGVSPYQPRSILKANSTSSSGMGNALGQMLLNNNASPSSSSGVIVNVGGSQGGGNKLVLGSPSEHHQLHGMPPPPHLPEAYRYPYPPRSVSFSEGSEDSRPRPSPPDGASSTPDSTSEQQTPPTNFQLGVGGVPPSPEQALRMVQAMPLKVQDRIVAFMEHHYPQQLSNQPTGSPTTRGGGSNAQGQNAGGYALPNQPQYHNQRQQEPPMSDQMAAMLYQQHLQHQQYLAFLAHQQQFFGSPQYMGGGGGGLASSTPDYLPPMFPIGQYLQNNPVMNPFSPPPQHQPPYNTQHLPQAFLASPGVAAGKMLGHELSDGQFPERQQSSGAFSDLSNTTAPFLRANTESGAFSSRGTFDQSAGITSSNGGAQAEQVLQANTDAALPVAEGGSENEMMTRLEVFYANKSPLGMGSGRRQDSSSFGPPPSVSGTNPGSHNTLFNTLRQSYLPTPLSHSAHNTFDAGKGSSGSISSPLSQSTRRALKLFPDMVAAWSASYVPPMQPAPESTLPKGKAGTPPTKALPVPLLLPPATILTSSVAPDLTNEVLAARKGAIAALESMLIYASKHFFTQLHQGAYTRHTRAAVIASGVDGLLLRLQPPSLDTVALHATREHSASHAAQQILALPHSSSLLTTNTPLHNEARRRLTNEMVFLSVASCPSHFLPVPLLVYVDAEELGRIAAAHSRNRTGKSSQIENAADAQPNAGSPSVILAGAGWDAKVLSKYVRVSLPHNYHLLLAKDQPSEKDALPKLPKVVGSVGNKKAASILSGHASNANVPPPETTVDTLILPSNEVRALRSQALGIGLMTTQATLTQILTSMERRGASGNSRLSSVIPPAAMSSNDNINSISSATSTAPLRQWELTPFLGSWLGRALSSGLLAEIHSGSMLGAASTSLKDSMNFSTSSARRLQNVDALRAQGHAVVDVDVSESDVGEQNRRWSQKKRAPTKVQSPPMQSDPSDKRAGSSKPLFEAAKATDASVYHSRRVLISMAFSSLPFLQKMELSRILELGINSIVADHRDIIVTALNALDIPMERPQQGPHTQTKAEPRRKTHGSSKAGNHSTQQELQAEAEAARELMIVLSALTNLWCADVLQAIFNQPEWVVAPLRVVENILAARLSQHPSLNVTFKQVTKGPSPLILASVSDISLNADNDASPIGGKPTVEASMLSAIKAIGTSSSGGAAVGLPQLLNFATSASTVHLDSATSSIHVSTSAMSNISNSLSTATSITNPVAFAEFFCKSARSGARASSSVDSHVYPSFALSAGNDEAHFLSTVANPHVRFLSDKSGRRMGDLLHANALTSAHSSNSSASRASVLIPAANGGDFTVPSSSLRTPLAPGSANGHHAVFAFVSPTPVSASVGLFKPCKLSGPRVISTPITSASLLPTPSSFTNPIHRLLMPQEAFTERVRRQHLGEILWKLRSDAVSAALRAPVHASVRKQLRKVAPSLSRQDLQMIGALGGSSASGGGRSFSPMFPTIKAKDVIDALNGPSYLYSDGRADDTVTTALSAADLTDLSAPPTGSNNSVRSSLIARFSKGMRFAIATSHDTAALKEMGLTGSSPFPRPGQSGTATVLMLNDFEVYPASTPTHSQTQATLPDGAAEGTNKNRAGRKSRSSSKKRAAAASFASVSSSTSQLQQSAVASNKHKIIATTIQVQGSKTHASTIGGPATISYFAMSTFLHNTATHAAMQTGFPFFTSVELYPLSLRCVALSTVEAATMVAASSPGGALRFTQENPKVFVSALQQLHFFVTQVAELLQEGTTNAAQIYLLEKQLISVCAHVESAEIQVRRLQDDLFVSEVRHHKIMSDREIAYPEASIKSPVSPTDNRKFPSTATKGGALKPTTTTVQQVDAAATALPPTPTKPAREEYDAALGVLVRQAHKLVKSLDERIARHQELLQEQSALRHQLNVFLRPGGKEELRKTRLTQILLHVNMFLDVFVFQGCLLGGSAHLQQRAEATHDAERAVEEAATEPIAVRAAKKAPGLAPRLLKTFWRQHVNDWEASLADEYETLGGSLRVLEKGERNSISDKAQGWVLGALRHVFMGGSHPGYGRRPGAGAAPSSGAFSTSPTSSIIKEAKNGAGSTSTLPNSSLRQRKPKRKPASSVKFPSEESNESAGGGSPSANAQGGGHAINSGSLPRPPAAPLSHHPLYKEQLAALEAGEVSEGSFRQFIRSSAAKAVGGSTVTLLSGAALRVLLHEERRRTRALLGKKPQVPKLAAGAPPISKTRLPTEGSSTGAKNLLQKPQPSPKISSSAVSENARTPTNRSPRVAPTPKRGKHATDNAHLDGGIITDLEELQQVDSVPALKVDKSRGGAAVVESHFQTVVEDISTDMPLLGGPGGANFGQSVGGWMAPSSPSNPRPMTSAAPVKSTAMEEEVIEVEAFPQQQRHSTSSNHSTPSKHVKRRVGGGRSNNNPLVPPSATSAVSDRLGSESSSAGSFSDAEQRHKGRSNQKVRQPHKRNKNKAGNKDHTNQRSRTSNKERKSQRQQRSSSESSWASENSEENGPREMGGDSRRGAATSMFPDTVESVFPSESPLDVALAARERFKRKRRLLLHLVAVESVECISAVPIPEAHIAAREQLLTQRVTATTTVDTRFLGDVTTGSGIHTAIQGQEILTSANRMNYAEDRLEPRSSAEGATSARGNLSSFTTAQLQEADADGGSFADSSTLLEKSAPSSSERHSRRSKRSKTTSVGKKRQPAKTATTANNSDSDDSETNDKERRREKRRERRRLERIRTSLKEERKKQDDYLSILRKNLVVFAELWADLDLSADSRLLLDAQQAPQAGPSEMRPATSHGPAGMTYSTLGSPIEDSISRLQRLRRAVEEDEDVSQQHRDLSPEKFGQAPASIVDEAHESTVSPGGSFSTAKPSFMSQRSVLGDYLGVDREASNSARLDQLIERIFVQNTRVSSVSRLIRDLSKLDNLGNSGSDHKKTAPPMTESISRRPSATITGATGELLSYREGVRGCMGCGGVFKECRATEEVANLIQETLGHATLFQPLCKDDIPNTVVSGGSTENPPSSSTNADPTTAVSGSSLDAGSSATTTGRNDGQQDGSSDDDDDWGKPSAPPKDRKAPFSLPLSVPSKRSPPTTITAAPASLPPVLNLVDESPETLSIQRFRQRLLGSLTPTSRAVGIKATKGSDLSGIDGIYCPRCTSQMIHGRSSVVAALSSQLAATSSKKSKAGASDEVFIESDLPLAPQLDSVGSPQGLDIIPHTKTTTNSAATAVYVASLQPSGNFGKYVKAIANTNLHNAPNAKLTIFPNVVASDALAVLERAAGTVSSVSTVYGEYLFVDKAKVEGALNNDNITTTIAVTKQERCLWDTNNMSVDSLNSTDASYHGTDAIPIPGPPEAPSSGGLDSSHSSHSGGLGSIYDEGGSYTSWPSGVDNPAASDSLADGSASFGAEVGVEQCTMRLSKKAAGGGTALYGESSWLPFKTSVLDPVDSIAMPVAQTALVAVMFVVMGGAMVAAQFVSTQSVAWAITAAGLGVGFVCCLLLVILTWAAASVQRQSRAWITKLRHALTRSSVAVDSILYRGPGAVVADLYSTRAELTALRLDNETSRKAHMAQATSAPLPGGRGSPLRGQELPLFKLYHEGSMLQSPSTTLLDATSQRRREQELELRVFQLRRVLQCMSNEKAPLLQEGSCRAISSATPASMQPTPTNVPAVSDAEATELRDISHEAKLAAKLARMLPLSSSLIRPGYFSQAPLSDDELLYGYCFSEELALRALRAQLLEGAVVVSSLFAHAVGAATSLHSSTLVRSALERIGSLVASTEGFDMSRLPIPLQQLLQDAVSPRDYHKITLRSSHAPTASSQTITRYPPHPLASSSSAGLTHYHPRGVYRPHNIVMSSGSLSGPPPPQQQPRSVPETVLSFMVPPQPPQTSTSTNHSEILSPKSQSTTPPQQASGTPIAKPLTVNDWDSDESTPTKQAGLDIVSAAPPVVETASISTQTETTLMEFSLMATHSESSPGTMSTTSKPDGLATSKTMSPTSGVDPLISIASATVDLKDDDEATPTPTQQLNPSLNVPSVGISTFFSTSGSQNHRSSYMSASNSSAVARIKGKSLHRVDDEEDDLLREYNDLARDDSADMRSDSSGSEAILKYGKTPPRSNAGGSARDSVLDPGLLTVEGGSSVATGLHSGSSGSSSGNDNYNTTHDLLGEGTFMSDDLNGPDKSPGSVRGSINSSAASSKGFRPFNSSSVASSRRVVASTAPNQKTSPKTTNADLSQISPNLERSTSPTTTTGNLALVAPQLLHMLQHQQRAGDSLASNHQAMFDSFAGAPPAADALVEAYITPMKGSEGMSVALSPSNSTVRARPYFPAKPAASGGRHGPPGLPLGSRKASSATHPVPSDAVEGIATFLRSLQQLLAHQIILLRSQLASVYVTAVSGGLDGGVRVDPLSSSTIPDDVLKDAKSLIDGGDGTTEENIHVISESDKPSLMDRAAALVQAVSEGNPSISTPFAPWSSSDMFSAVSELLPSIAATSAFLVSSKDDGDGVGNGLAKSGSGLICPEPRGALEDTSTMLQAHILLYRQLELHLSAITSDTSSSSGGGGFALGGLTQLTSQSVFSSGRSLHRSESAMDAIGSLPVFASLTKKSPVVAVPNRLSQSVLEAHNQKQHHLHKGVTPLGGHLHNFLFIPHNLAERDRNSPRLVYLSHLGTYLFDDGSQRITSFRISEPPKANTERRGKQGANHFASGGSPSQAAVSLHQKGLVHIRGNDLHRDTVIIGVHKARIFLWNKAAELISKFTEAEVLGHKLQWIVDAASIQLITHLYNTGQYRSYCKIKLLSKTGDRVVALKARICKANYMDVDSLGATEVYDGSRLIIIGTQIDQTELQPLSYLYSLHMRVLTQYIRSSLGGTIPVHLQEMIDALSWTNLLDRVQNSKHWSAMTASELFDFLVVPEEVSDEVEIKAIVDSGVAHAFYCDKSELQMTLKEILKFAAEAAPSLQKVSSGDYDPDSYGSATSSILGGASKNRIIVAITQRKYGESYCLQIRVEIPDHKVPAISSGTYASHRPSVVAAAPNSPTKGVASVVDDRESMIGGLVLYEDRNIQDLSADGGSAPASVQGPPGPPNPNRSKMRQMDSEKYLAVMRDALDKPGSKFRPSRGLIVIGDTGTYHQPSGYGASHSIVESRPASAAASRPLGGGTVTAHATTMGGSVGSGSNMGSSPTSSSRPSQNIVSLFMPISLYRLDAPDIKAEVKKSQAGITFNLYLFIKNPVLHAYFFSQLHDRRHHNIIDCSSYDDLRMALRKSQTDAILIETDDPSGKAFAKRLVEYQKAEAVSGVVNPSVFIVSVATLERTQSDGPQRDGSWLMSSELTEKGWNALASRLEANKGDREIIQMRSKDDYQKGRLVGQGASGYVYEVHDPIRGGKFAMKEIAITAMTDRKVLTKEIETMSQLVHANIVRYLETKVLDGRMCIYMELCDTSLEALLKRHASPPLLPRLPCQDPEAAARALSMAFAAAPPTPGGANRLMPMPFFKIMKYTYQIVKAIMFLHNQEIFHRDIKPANVLLKNDLVKLSDFGSALRDTRRLDLAILGGEAAEEDVSAPKGKSSYQAVVGTLRYMAPEVIRFNKYSGKCDIWSIGITLLEMLQAMPGRIKSCREMIDFVDLYAMNESHQSRPQSRVDHHAASGSNTDVVPAAAHHHSSLPFTIPPFFGNIRGIPEDDATPATSPNHRANDGLNDDCWASMLSLDETPEECQERQRDDAQAANGVPLEITPSRIRRLERDVALYGPLAFDFVVQCLTLNSEKRASASVLLAHPFLAQCVDGTLPYLNSNVALPLSMLDGSEQLDRALFGGGENEIITDAGLRKKLEEEMAKNKRGGAEKGSSSKKEKKSKREKSKKSHKPKHNKPISASFDTVTFKSESTTTPTTVTTTTSGSSSGAPTSWSGGSDTQVSSPLMALGATTPTESTDSNNPADGTTTASPTDSEMNRSAFASTATTSPNPDSTRADDDEEDDFEDGGFLSIALAPLTNKSNYVSPAEREKINAPSVMNSLRPQVMPPVSMNINDYMNDYQSSSDGSGVDVAQEDALPPPRSSSLRSGKGGSQKSGNRKKRRHSSSSSSDNQPPSIGDATEQFNSMASDASTPARIHHDNSGTVDADYSATSRLNESNAETIIVNEDDTRTYIKRGYDGLLTAVPLDDEADDDVQPSSTCKVTRGSSLMSLHKLSSRKRRSVKKAPSVVVDPLFAGKRNRDRSDSSSSAAGDNDTRLQQALRPTLEDIEAVSDSTSCEVSDSSSSGSGKGVVVDPLFQASRTRAQHDDTPDSSSDEAGPNSSSSSSSDWGDSAAKKGHTVAKKRGKKKNVNVVVDPLFGGGANRRGGSSSDSSDSSSGSSSSGGEQSRSLPSKKKNRSKENVVVDPLFGGRRENVASQSSNSSSSSSGASSSGEDSATSEGGSSSSSSGDDDRGVDAAFVDPLFVKKTVPNATAAPRSTNVAKDGSDSDDW